MKLALLALLALTASCGKKDGNSSSPAVTATNSSMFSEWVPRNGSTPINFTSYQYDVPGSWHMAGCNMDIVFEDKDDDGESYNFLVMEVSNSTWDGTSGSSDPSCSDFNGIWMMTVEGKMMEMCAPPTWNNCYHYDLKE